MHPFNFHKSYATLPDDVKNRYLEKISVINNIDPYCVRTNGNDIPASVNTGHVVDYLLHHKSPFSGMLAGSSKSLEAYKKFEAGYVSSVEGCEINDYFIIRGKVQKSMRLSEPPHCAWIIIEKNGTVISAHCGCAVGVSEACSHVATILYALANLHSITINQKITVTEVPAYWMRPSKGIKEDIYHKVNDIDYGRRIKRFNDVECKGASKADFLNLIRKLRDDGSDAAVIYKFCGQEDLLCKTCDETFVPDDILINKNILIQNIFRPEYEAKSLDELREIGKKINFQLNETDINRVEQLTKGQTASDFWHHVRIGRITASVLKEVVNSSFDFPPPKQSLLTKICHPYKCKFDTPATLYGRNNEKHAKKYVKSLFENHENVKFHECGLVINKDRPYIAASPDLMVQCPCCGLISIEIKCPYRLRSRSSLDNQLSVTELIASKDSFLQIDDENRNRFKLVKSHHYFYQIQAQMFVTNADFGLFIVWSKREQITIVVQKDLSFWLRCLIKSEKYFYRIIIPELLGNAFSRSIV